ncbi:hypothetical protein N7532_003854 [Penicillium argentinense]|uniref:Uncharacterized protein n=1 Tax=Penicillium argentinense TaxID=1131581 RepID=A0A9W9FNR4_9EURO|nr:uncharacterized protein N7532_003854 [Penicillium argentinense]KAJ5103325.1 hypothetical protein N7532_003854 [Penicillium argentinense]
MPPLVQKPEPGTASQLDLENASLDPIEVISRDEASDEVRVVCNQQHDIDIIFNIFTGTIRLVEKVDNQPRSEPDKEIIYLTHSRIKIVNLEGLSDNSLLFSFRPKRSFYPSLASQLQLCHQVHGFPRDPAETPLCKAILDNNRNSVLHLVFPSDRHKGWKTIALILLTYRKLSPADWHRITNSQGLGDVAGFNWASFFSKRRG